MLRDFQQRVVVPNAPALTQYPGGLAAAITLASLVEREAEVPTRPAADRRGADQPAQEGDAPGMRRDGAVCAAAAQGPLVLCRFAGRFAVQYLHCMPGLPPTPICNPGLPSIEAALHPAPVGLSVLRRPARRQPHLQPDAGRTRPGHRPDARARQNKGPERTRRRRHVEFLETAHPDAGRAIGQRGGPERTESAGHHGPSSRTWTTRSCPGGIMRSRPA